MNDDLLTAEVRAAFDAHAGGFTPAPLDAADLWSRGRTHRRRDLLQLVAAVVLVAALAAATAFVGVSEAAPVNAPDGGALPAHVHPPTDDDLDALPASTDLAVGRTSVVTVLEDDRVLLVSAADGEHRVRNLPGLVTTPGDDGGEGPTLSPDGYRLAWSTLKRTSVSEMVSTVVVADLRDGSTTETVLGEGVEIPRAWEVTFSPDSSVVGWRGSSHRPLDGDGDQEWMGLVDLDRGAAAASELVDLDLWDTPFVVSDDGRLMTIDARGLRTFVVEGDTLTERPRHAIDLAETSWEQARLSPDGRTLAAQGWVDDEDTAGTPIFLLEVPGRQDTSATIAPQMIRTDRTLGEGVGGAHPQGWTPEGALLASSVEQADEESMTHQVRRWTPSGSDGAGSGNVGLTSDDLLLDIATTDVSGGSPTLASDLGDRAPVDFRAPAWAPDHRPWLLPSLAAALVAALGWLAWTMWRRRTAVAPAAGAPATDTIGGIRSAVQRWLDGGAGQRARVAALTVLCLVLATTWVMLLRPLVPSESVTAPGGGTLPTRTHEVGYDNGSGDLSAVRGPLAVAILGDWDDPTLVSARDGSHLRVQANPGDDAASIHHSDFSLSPDGMLAATGWARAGSSPEAQVAAGFSVLDLTTGERTDVPVTGPNGRPVAVTDFAWSGDGRHLAWSGDEAASWTGGGSSWRGAAREVGVTDPRDPDGTRVRVSRAQDSALAVGNDGVGRLVAGRRLYTFDGSGEQGHVSARHISTTGVAWDGAALSPDQQLLVVGVTGSPSGPAAGLRTLDLTDPTSQVQMHPWTGAAPDETVRVLGVSAGGRLLVHRHTGMGSGPWSIDAFESVTSTRPRTLTRTTAVGLSVAVDLADRQPTAFTAPRDPMGDTDWFYVALVTLLLVAGTLRLARATRDLPRRVRS